MPSTERSTTPINESTPFTHDGKTMSLFEWAVKLNYTPKSLKQKIKKVGIDAALSCRATTAAARGRAGSAHWRQMYRGRSI